MNKNNDSLKIEVKKSLHENINFQCLILPKSPSKSICFNCNSPCVCVTVCLTRFFIPLFLLSFFVFFFFSFSVAVAVATTTSFSSVFFFFFCFQCLTSHTMFTILDGGNAHHTINSRAQNQLKSFLTNSF